MELSFKEKLINSIGSPIYYPNMDFEFYLNGISGFYDTFGFVGIFTANECEAVRLLNTIFGVSLIFGTKCLSANESELYFMEIDPDSRFLGSFSWQSSDSKRPTPYTAHAIRENSISSESMSKILETTQRVLLNDDLKEYLLFLVESYTHLYDSEYSPSFIFSWFIVEKYISQKFSELLSEKCVSNKRKSKFENHDKWSIDTKMETLNFCGKVSDEEYQFISAYKIIRNNFVHDDSQIGKEKANSLFEMSRHIVEKKIIKQMN